MFLTKRFSYDNDEPDPHMYNYDYLLHGGDDEIVYFLSNDAMENNTLIAGSKAYRCDGNEFNPCFKEKYNTEQFHIANILITNDEDNNKGIMTILVCDILLAILDREMAWYNNIEVSLVDNSSVIDNKGYADPSISVYHRLFRGYRKGVDISDDRLVVEGNNLNYLFPIKTRKDDIHYYQKLRNEKIERFKKNNNIF